MKDLNDEQDRIVQVKNEENEKAKAKREKGARAREASPANDPTPDSSQDFFLPENAQEEIFGPVGMRYGREEIAEAAVLAESVRAQQQHSRDTGGMADVPKEEQIRRLNEKLRLVRRTVLDVGDAGDCLFEAACAQYKQLPDQPTLHFMRSAQALREMVASWYRTNREVLAKSPFAASLAPDAQDPVKWEAYCKKIAKAREWGDQLEVLAIASLTNCVVTLVLTGGESQTYSPITQDGEITGSTRCRRAARRGRCRCRRGNRRRGCSRCRAPPRHAEKAAPALGIPSCQ